MFFEEFGFVSTGWKEGILIVRVEIPYQNKRF